MLSPNRETLSDELSKSFDETLSPGSLNEQSVKSQANPELTSRYSLLFHDILLAAKLNDVAALHLLNESIVKQLGVCPGKSALWHRGQSKSTSTWKTSKSEDAASVRKLLDFEDVDGWTPLHTACESRSIAAVDYLLSEGCPPNKAAGSNYSGMTPMHFACLSGHPEILNSMVQAQGTLLAPTANGLMPIDMASFSSSPCQEAMDIIETHSGIQITFLSNAATDIPRGPCLNRNSYYSLQVSAGDTHQYRISSEREIEDAVLTGDKPFSSPVASMQQAAKAIIEYANTTPDTTNPLHIKQCDDATPTAWGIISASQHQPLSDSWGDLAERRENYMTGAQHARRILESEIPNKENTPLGDAVVDGTSSVGRAPRPGTPLKKTPLIPADPLKLFAIKEAPKPATKGKQARFTPVNESPVSSRSNSRRVRGGHPVLSLRRALSDITPAQPSTPTQAAQPVKRLPTPWPKRGRQVHPALDSLQFDTTQVGVKENQRVTSEKSGFVIKTKTKALKAVKRVAFQDKTHG